MFGSARPLAIETARIVSEIKLTGPISHFNKYLFAFLARSASVGSNHEV